MAINYAELHPDCTVAAFQVGRAMERIKVLVGERRPTFQEAPCTIINTAEDMEVVGAASSSELRIS